MAQSSLRLQIHDFNNDASHTPPFGEWSFQLPFRPKAAIRRKAKGWDFLAQTKGEFALPSSEHRAITPHCSPPLQE